MTEHSTAGPLLGPAEIRELADTAGIRPTKTLGQNFVIDPNTIRRIVAQAHLSRDEHVLEVGPGLGSLTLGLLAASSAVTAVEIDPPLARQLPETVARFFPEGAGRLRVVEGDAARVRELPGGTEPTALVANLPYNVAVPVLLNILEAFPSIRHGLVMVQEEVADRLAAGPGSRVYGVPSVKASWYADVRKAGVIGKNVFWPAPKIASGLVRFERREPPVADRLRIPTFAVVDAAFAQRRKTLRAALSSWAGSGAHAEKILREAGIEPAQRGEKLDVADFARIAEASNAVAADRGDPAPPSAPEDETAPIDTDAANPAEELAASATPAVPGAARPAAEPARPVTEPREDRA
ncbi:16S rRNA (adenine(1518)-N(6)/adenine(1519)-N(6))-dimethyltransferase RsmA [Kocuria tytonicola]|uniref:Ribosomal RNA small subunit methyltransferase A n=1 Tax=Kocuria tytonicola TaxID=2055946 RepID=A0A3L9L2E3_9MICC|nr:16S rRNA (adenine(1518)-N(6)/adenine(1519)-N(6))-dimethyltransferase RsmA [Kocuria tytonicola]RLY92264.1 16S rRNA (adenine(1518)-N(6)/adenine(1519)-N(6))-dimethyltransferase RsmA [Kocuria tytonicola]